MGLPGIVSVPPSVAGDQFSTLVYNAPISGITTSAATNLFTCPASGTFKVTLCASQTVLGVGSPGATTFTPAIVFTDPLGASTTSVTMGAYATGSANGTLGYLALVSGLQSLTFRAKAGTTVTSTITVTGGGGTTNPTVAVYHILEALGQ